MPKVINAGGKQISVPDDATDDEISQILNPPQEGAFPRFMHSAGLPASFSEVMPTLKGLASPEADPAHPAMVRPFEKIPVIGPAFRSQEDTYEQPGWGKVYGSIPLVGPPGYRMGKQLESGDYAGAAGSGANIVTQIAGLRGAAPEIAGAVHDVGAPMVRGMVRGTNATLEKAPGAVGAAAGAGIAHETGLPPWMGGAAGYAIGREVLPKLKIPGENFGAGPRMPNQTFFTKYADPFLRSPGIEGEPQATAGEGAAAQPWQTPQPSAEPVQTPGSGTFMADPRTNEDIIQDVHNMRGGQGKIAMQESGEPQAAGARPARPGYGTAEVPIEERPDMQQFYGKTPTKSNLKANQRQMGTPAQKPLVPEFIAKAEPTKEDLAFQDANTEDILQAALGQLRLRRAAK